MPVLDIIRIPPAPNSSGGCTRDSSLHARLSVVQISHILPRIVLATSKRVLYPVSSSTKLFQRSFRAARVCQVAASGAMCNNSRIHRTVKIYRSKIPHSGGMNAEGWKVARKLLDGAIWEIREEKRGKKLWNRSRIERRTRTSRPFFRYLFFQRFMLHYLKLAIWMAEKVKLDS